MASQAIKASAQQLGCDEIIEAGYHYCDAKTCCISKTPFESGHIVVLNDEKTDTPVQ